MKTDGEQKDYTHLSDFLKKHINRSSKVAKAENDSTAYHLNVWELQSLIL